MFNNGVLDSFTCLLTVDIGTQGASCSCTNCCSEGYLCATAQQYGSSCQGTTCCTTYCEVNDPSFVCPGAGQQCLALFDPSDPDYGNLGACLATWP